MLQAMHVSNAHKHCRYGRNGRTNGESWLRTIDIPGSVTRGRTYGDEVCG